RAPRRGRHPQRGSARAPGRAGRDSSVDARRAVAKRPRRCAYPRRARLRNRSGAGARFRHRPGYWGGLEAADPHAEGEMDSALGALARLRHFPLRVDCWKCDGAGERKAEGLGPDGPAKSPSASGTQADALRLKILKRLNPLWSPPKGVFLFHEPLRSQPSGLCPKVSIFPNNLFNAARQIVSFLKNLKQLLVFFAEILIRRGAVPMEGLKG